MSELSRTRISDLRVTPSDTSIRYQMPDLDSNYIRPYTAEEIFREMYVRESMYADYLSKPFYYTHTKSMVKNRLRNFDQKFNKVLKENRQKKEIFFDWDWLRSHTTELHNTFNQDNPFSRIRVSNLCPEVEPPVRPFSDGPIQPQLTADTFRFTQFR